MSTMAPVFSDASALPEATRAPGMVAVPGRVVATPPGDPRMNVGAWAYKRGTRYHGWSDMDKGTGGTVAPALPRAVTLGIVPKDWHGAEYNAPVSATPTPGV